MAKELEKLVQTAQQAITRRQNDLALKCYKKAIKLKPDMPNLHYGLATVYYLSNELDSAVKHFKEVTRLDPLRAGAFINLGAVYNKLNQLDDAIAALRKGIQLDVGKPEGYYNLGLVYRRRGQIDLAIQAYREATRIEPRMADAHYNLANLYLEKGQFNLAISHYDKALDLRPNWDKATEGMDNARAALEEELEEISNEPTTFDPDKTNEVPTQRMLDPDRMVDPHLHGGILMDLHRVTKESEQLSREFVSLLQKEIEPAIKVLSSALLYSDRSATELDQCVHKVETALSHMHVAQKNLQGRIQQVNAFGQKLLEN